MQLPRSAAEQKPEVFVLADSDPQQVDYNLGVQHATKYVDNIYQMDLETQALVLDRIFVLEQEAKFKLETARLKEQIAQEREDERQLLNFIQADFQLPTEDRQWVYQIEFDVSEDIADSNPFLYVKRVLEGNKNVEISYKQLSASDIPLFDEAKAKEVAEVLGSMALRAIQSKEELKDALSHPERHIPMRWVLTWKPLQPAEPPQPGKPTTAVPKGDFKAKARVVLLGFKHPDLVKRNSVTGQPELKTAAPTISRTGRNLLLQSFAFDEHEMESADAKSAFLQASNREEGRRLWTKAVPEIAVALGVQPGQLLRVLGAIYGLTNAPRIFWEDVGQKFQELGGIPHPMDRCIWIFKDPEGKVFARIGSQVDDFLMGGDPKSKHWMNLREKIKKLYEWSPWQKGDFIYAGCKLRQLTSFSTHLSSAFFCNSLTPVAIQADGSRSDDDKMTPIEVFQTRALLMKAQWRAFAISTAVCGQGGLQLLLCPMESCEIFEKKIPSSRTCGKRLGKI